MVSRSKRSVSPHSTDERVTKKKKGILSSIVGLLYPFASKSDSNKHPSGPVYQGFSIPNDTSNDYNFSSTKKRSLSIVPRSKNENTPRSLTLNSNMGSYQTFSESFKSFQGGQDNDLERRLSHVYDNALVKDSVMNDIADSESEDSVISNSHHDRPEEPKAHFNNGISFDERQTFPFVVEHEVAPLYRDYEGNLVRPPFINLDPRERYHLIQLKRSITASEVLRNRIKYMIDPNEVESSVESNKVETSTQTHDEEFLNKSLNFISSERKHPKSADSINGKRQKNRKGFFSGEFFYNVDDKESEPVSNSFKGYLGHVATPQLTETKNKENSFKTGGSKDLELDEEYVKKTNKLSNIFKLKSGINGSKNISNAAKEKTKPSSAFQFHVDNDKVKSFIDKSSDNVTQRKRGSEFDSAGLSEGIPGMDHSKELRSTAPIFNFDSSRGDKAPLNAKTELPSHKVDLPFGSKRKNGDSEDSSDSSELRSKTQGRFTGINASKTSDIPLELNANGSLSQDINKSFKGKSARDSSKEDLKSSSIPFTFSVSSSHSNENNESKQKEEKRPKPAFTFGNTKLSSNSDDSGVKSTFNFSSKPASGELEFLNQKDSKENDVERPKSNSTISFDGIKKQEAGSTLGSSNGISNPVFNFAGTSQGAVPLSPAQSSDNVGSDPSKTISKVGAGSGPISGSNQGGALSVSSATGFAPSSKPLFEGFGNLQYPKSVSASTPTPPPSTNFNFGSVNSNTGMNPSFNPNSNINNSNTAGTTGNPVSRNPSPFNFNPSTKPAFNFTGSKEGTPDPASIFGAPAPSIPQPPGPATGFSFSATNSAFTNNNPLPAHIGTPQAQGIPQVSSTNTPTPPLMSGRKIAQMRQRRR